MFNKKLVLVSIIIFSLVNVNFVTINPVESNTINFILIAKAPNNNPEYFDILNLVRQHLRPLGIDLHILACDWPSFISELLVYHDYDLVCFGMSFGYNLNYYHIYGEEGSMNLFGYDTLLDWREELASGLNEWYLTETKNILPQNSYEHFQHFWDWQEYLMNKICPILPIYTSKTQTAYWKPLSDYNSTRGLIQSWGKMHWRSTINHDGQTDRSEIVVNDNDYFDLNPLFMYDCCSNSKYINSFTLDPLLWMDSDRSIWPHLGSITYLNNTHIKIDVRQGITWANDTDDLFYNERLDAKDIYFNLYLWKNVIHEENTFNWIKDMKITGNYTLEIFIDADPLTPESEPSNSFLESLCQYILPEHYLNQTQLLDGITPDITHTSWQKFSKYCFGTGLFEINSQLEHHETILTRRESSWWLNTNITNDPALNWLARFGYFSVESNYKNLTKLKLIITDNFYTQEILELFEKGKLDILSVNSDYEVKQNQKTKINIQQTSVSPSFHMIAYNLRTNREVIADRSPTPNDPGMSIGLAVRKAINYAINREELNQIISGNKKQIVDYPINPAMGIWLNTKILRYNYNLQLAKELMLNAGFIIDNFTPRLNGFSILLSLFAIIAIIPTSVLLTKQKISKNK
ncbi:MAG: hypothetical protein JXA54_01475 [Candidatus Heimdallarchaeota archaeon]|nr:hypothetical protein [Candidatus Heimdallarchaeota archaeon]